MNNFQFKTNIVNGDLANLINYVDVERVKSILLLSSPSVIKNSIVERFVTLIKGTAIRLQVYGEIRPDAPVDCLERIIDQQEKPDLIIAIGGGSVIDSAKAISVGWQGASLLDLFYKKKELPTKKIPLFVVPSTAGTGAELSYGAILLDKNENFKSGIRGSLIQPELAFIDVQIYSSAPSKLISEVGFDCLTHAVETYVSKASNPIVQYQSVGAINTVLKYLPQASSGNRNALQKMAIAATMMGANLAMSSTCLPHRIQYVIGPLTNTSHAHGLIMLYRGWLKEISLTENFRLLVNDLNMTSDDFIAIIDRLKTDLKIDYRLGDVGVFEPDIEHITSQVTGNLTNDPCYKSTETINQILKNSL